MVDQDEIILRAPFDKSSTDIEKILLDKIKWISTKQKEFNQRTLEIIKPTYENKSTLPYLGINYELSIDMINRIENNNALRLEDNKFIVYTQEKVSGQRDIIKKLYTEWLTSAATKIFKDKIDKHSKIIGVSPNGIVIKNLRNRWGSLSADGSINLNINLMKATEEIIDYIIIHELCHFKIKGHSYQFWDNLKQFVPDYPQKVKWLETNSNSLL